MMFIRSSSQSSSGQNDEQRLYFECRNCQSVAPVKDACIFESNHSDDRNSYEQFMSKNIRYDVTLPRAHNIPCPTCIRNNDGGSSSVLFIKYDADLKFLYFCERCDTFWKAGGGRSAAVDSSKDATADSPKDAAKDSPKDAAKDTVSDSPNDVVAADSPNDAATDAVSDSPKDVVNGIDDVVGERKSRAKVIGMRAEQIARGAPALIDVPRMMGSRRFDACEVASAELDAGLLPLVVARTLSDGKTELVRIFKSSSTS
eukprot:gene14882-biopygen23920